MPPPTEGLPVPDTAATARRRQTALAGHLGDPATARQGLADPAAAVRATALGALARTGRLTAGDVTAAAADHHPRVRARAAELAATFDPALTAVAAHALGDDEPQVVEAGCFALGEIGLAAAPAVPALSAVGRNHTDPLCREAAVAALGAIGDPAGLPAILAATSDKPAVRRRAVLALAPFGGPEVDAALERARRDRDWQVRQAAEDLGGRQG
jgi:HEAT repeat protein